MNETSFIFNRLLKRSSSNSKLEALVLVVVEVIYSLYFVKVYGAMTVSVNKSQ